MIILPNADIPWYVPFIITYVICALVWFITGLVGLLAGGPLSDNYSNKWIIKTSPVWLLALMYIVIRKWRET
ncbi:hypothetical protein UFOVP276_10 [uncultured Caudovirales phage]|uniref:Uncharacterized protein n=1 Tax=uncultured Caudovirales phage TaxID=2100421 RepID=A0A6J5LEJ6_9CAUD|nr:hypothetical protein UFOVP127_147 [uncultured Caudovirales phage]CAB4134775.1 hypothetical protein UFOVP276_10 [uncultured Caudovirales phage]